MTKDRLIRFLCEISEIPGEIPVNKYHRSAFCTIGLKPVVPSVLRTKFYQALFSHGELHFYARPPFHLVVPIESFCIESVLKAQKGIEGSFLIETAQINALFYGPFKNRA